MASSSMSRKATNQVLRCLLFTVWAARKTLTNLSYTRCKIIASFALTGPAMDEAQFPTLQVLTPTSRTLKSAAFPCKLRVPMSDIISAVVKHFDLKDITLVGHSLGCLIAMSLAAKHPFLVSKLVLFASAPTPARDRLSAYAVTVQ